MFKTIFSITIFVLHTAIAISQPNNLQTFNHDFNGIFNPSSLDNYYLTNGLQERYRLDIQYRDQWFLDGIKGRPVTYGINFNGLFQHKHLFGAGLLFQKVGPFSTYNANLRYGFRIIGSDSDRPNLENRLFIGIGLQCGESFINVSKLDSRETDDDVLLNINLNNFFFLNGSIGISGRTLIPDSRLFLIYGLSYQRLTNFESPFKDQDIVNSNLGLIWHLGKNKIARRTTNNYFLELSGYSNMNFGFFSSPNTFQFDYAILTRMYIDFNSNAGSFLNGDYLNIAFGYQTSNVLLLEIGNFFSSKNEDYKGFGINFTCQFSGQKIMSNLNNLQSLETRLIISF